MNATLTTCTDTRADSLRSTLIPTEPGAARPRPSRVLMRRQLDREARTELRHLQVRDTQRATTHGQPPDPGPWASHLAAAAVDAVRGLRPLHQLDRWIAPPLAEDLAGAARGRPPRRQRQMPAATRAIQVHAIGAGVVEAAASVDDGHRRWIVALRLEELRGRWLATALDMA